MRIDIINGPNLNLIGTREPEIYGTRSLDDYLKSLSSSFADCVLDTFQSNHEGELIDRIQQSKADGLIVNLGGYSHTSIALHDALKSLSIPIIEVHISNIHAREEFREKSITGRAAKGIITGLGLEGYSLAIQYLIKAISDKQF